jgi:long-chain acyl-CoA synthetase
VEKEKAVALMAVQDLPDSIPAMVWQRVTARGPTVILRQKERGIWKAISWAALGIRARNVGLGLKASGLRSGDVAAVLSESRPEWIFAELGVLGVGGISTGLYPSSSADQVAHVLCDSGCRVLFVENDEHLDKALHVRDRCPALERIVIFDMKGLRELGDPMCESLADLLARGEDYAAAHPGAWEKGITELRADQLALLIYSAGTTGAPKGAMLSHRNILFQVTNAATLLNQGPKDDRLAFMPMGHAMERVLGLYLALYAGAISNYVESSDTVLDNLQELRPTVLGALPRFWEKLHARVTTGIAAATWLQRQLFAWALGAGLRTVDHRLAGGVAGPWRRAEAWLARHLVLRNVRRALGLDRVRLATVGATEISPELIRWFMALGIDLVEIYGQTECVGLAAIMPAGTIRLASVGKPVPYCDLSLAPDGEILLRGGCVFAGYWNQPELTARALAGGWLHTGDLGHLDDGYLYISGRKQDMIMTTRGHKLMPAAIERELKVCPYIADALVVGHERAFLACLVMVDPEALEMWAQDNRVPFTSFAALAHSKAVLDLIGLAIEHANAKLDSGRGVRAFRVIAQRLEPEDPELTPVMKLRRRFVNEKYHDLIEEMYRGSREPTAAAIGRA